MAKMIDEFGPGILDEEERRLVEGPPRKMFIAEHGITSDTETGTRVELEEPPLPRSPKCFCDLCVGMTDPASEWLLK